jgi:hypothetical protein
MTSPILQPRQYFLPLLALVAVAAAPTIVLAKPGDQLFYAAIAGVSLIFVVTFRNWRAGLLLFLIWVLLEDMLRKYLGNSMVVYFAKDVLAGACYLSFYLARRREQLPQAKPRFFLPLAMFAFWALIEMFNPNSPSVWYGLLGMKVYFWYFPLFFLGYAFVRNEADLKRFLLNSLVIAGFIAMLGSVQAISGEAVLSPDVLAPDIAALGTLTRVDPTTNVRFIRPPSVFVSNPRFAQYLLLAWILGLGTTTYYFDRRLPGKMWMLSVLAVILVSIFLSGVRGPLVWALLSGLCIVAIRGRKVALAIGSVVLFVAIAGTAASYAYPEALGSRLGFYQQTMLPSSSSVQWDLGYRVWTYPMQEFAKAFNFAYWPIGYGTGTRSLGSQYVERILGAPQLNIGVESGYGNLMLEMGLPGLVLWLAWVGSLLMAEIEVLRKLKGRPLFVLGLVPCILSFVLLVALMAGGVTAYQDFVQNVYLWLLLGVLFRLPSLAKMPDFAQPVSQNRDQRIRAISPQFMRPWPT